MRNAFRRKIYGALRTAVLMTFLCVCILYWEELKSICMFWISIWQEKSERGVKFYKEITTENYFGKQGI